MLGSPHSSIRSPPKVSPEVIRATLEREAEMTRSVLANGHFFFVVHHLTS